MIDPVIETTPIARIFGLVPVLESTLTVEIGKAAIGSISVVPAPVTAGVITVTNGVIIGSTLVIVFSTGRILVPNIPSLNWGRLPTDLVVKMIREPIRPSIKGSSLDMNT